MYEWQQIRIFDFENQKYILHSDFLWGLSLGYGAFLHILRHTKGGNLVSELVKIALLGTK